MTGDVVAGSDGTLLSPLSGTDAVAHRHRLQQQTDGIGWWIVGDGGHSGPFQLQGAVGRLSVDPDGERPAIGTDESVRLAGDETLPADVRARFAESDRFDPDEHPQYLASAVDEPRRYTESAIEAGETVYVYGCVTEDDRIDAGESSEFRFGHREPSDMGDERSSSLRDALDVALFGFVVLFLSATSVAAGLLLLDGADVLSWFDGTFSGSANSNAGTHRRRIYSRNTGRIGTRDRR